METKKEVDVEKTIKEFDGLMTSMFSTCDNIFKEYVSNDAIITITMKEMGLTLTEGINSKIISSNYDKFKKGYVSSDTNKKYDHFLGIFDKILNENKLILYQAIDQDDWIRSEPVKIMFGYTVGKSSDFVLHLSDFYKISLGIKYKHEQNIKEFPDFFKPDEKNRLPAFLLLHCFKIFRLTNTGKDQEKAKSINTIIGKIESKLGISVNNPANIMEGLKPVLSVGADMLNKYRGNDKTPISSDQLHNIFGKVLNAGSIQGMMNGLKDASAGGRQPDLGSVISSVMSNMNPEEMMNSLKNAVDSEVPDLANELNKEKKEEKKEKVEDNGTEVIEVEEVEKVIEEEEVVEQ